MLLRSQSRPPASPISSPIAEVAELEIDLAEQPLIQQSQYQQQQQQHSQHQNQARRFSSGRRQSGTGGTVLRNPIADGRLQSVPRIDLTQAEDDDDEFYQTFQYSTSDMRKTNLSSKQGNCSGALFTNFEDVRLTDEERVYLQAAGIGDVGVIRQSLEEVDNPQFNANCVDYMGRNALHLAVDSENMDCIELLCDKLSFECIEEALLHAISKGLTKIVRVVIEHPNYMAGEDKIKRMDYNNAFFRTEEKSQFSPDITPLILAAHYNNHEMIQMFLARNHTIEKPHVITCLCEDCQIKQNYDSLKRSRSRLNAYRALASPAYMALSSPDPIMTTFELRQEMMKLAEVEKEFKTEYLTLVEQCMNFACEMMDLCRGTQEVEAVISDNLEASEVCGTNVRDPLGRLRMAIRYEEKKFVGHANCQQYLTSIWYGSETAFLQSWSLVRKVGLSLVAAPLLPLICIVYIALPTSKVSKGLRCPAAKFATHTVSHFLFLVLLAAATFRVDDSSVTHSVTEEAVRDSYGNTTEERKLFLKKMLRPESTVITPVQILIILWTAGHLLSEIKQVYFQGLKEVALNAYSMLNFFILTLYIASYTIRIIVDLKIKEANHCYNATQQANEFLLRNISYLNITRTKELEERFNNFLLQLRMNSTCRQYMYFLEASRFKWVAHDPEIVSDVLFAVANVLSFARTIFLMPAFEVLGPLQISFSRMLTDIARFLVLFALVLLAFMVGMHNLYWYYGLQRIAKMVVIGNQTFAVDEPASEPFEGLVHTLFTMFWAMFSNFQLASLPIKHPNYHDDVTYQYKDGMIRTNSSTEVVETVGMTLMAFYHVIIIIVLINMLIAMMSHSFEDIQSECDVEWKFARTKLWLNYIDNGSTLPVPYNLLPTPQSLARAYRFVRRFFSNQSVFASESTRSTAFIKTRRDAVCKSMDIVAQDTSYADIMQRLVRRYLFKLERENDVEDVQKNPKEGISIRAEDMIGASPEGLFAQDDSKAVHFADADESNFQRRSGNRQTMSSSSRGRGPSIADSRSPPLQFLAIPQLDGIQRTQKILDMRLQNLQAQSDQLNLAAGNARIKEEIQLLRDLIGENQKALLSLVRAVQQIQETTRMLNNNMQQWVTQQSASLSLKTMLVNEGGSTSDDPQQAQQQSSEASGSNKSSKRREKHRVKDSKV